MGALTAIEWADHTFNPWEGCQKVGPGCDHCYAETRNARFGGGEAPNWGPHAPRRRTSAANWAQPRRWNREAEAAGTRPFVFCASLADVFDNAVDPAWRADLFTLIRETPHLVWLLLTKRPQNVLKMLPREGLPGNVALLTTVVLPEEVERNVAPLLKVPGALFYGVSAEPLLGDIAGSLRPWLHEECCPAGALADHPCLCDASPPHLQERRIGWVIVGGESGPGARPMHPDWARKLRDQCSMAGAVFMFKQWGEWGPHKPLAGGDLRRDVAAGRVRVVHPSGQSEEEIFQLTGGRNTLPGTRYMARVGKTRAGRTLDGRTHDGRPEIAA